jgi:hypothetical protein
LANAWSAWEVNKAIWLGCLASIGLSAWIVFGIHLGGNSPDVAPVSIPGAESPATPPAVLQPQKQSNVVHLSPDVSAPPPAADRPLRWDRQRSSDFNAEATMYARTFQPGMTLDDSLPIFVTMFESSVGSSVIAETFQNHQQLPMDEWSADTESRLRGYFEAQPEISMTKVSVSCRSTRCLLQFMELPPTQAERPTSRSSNAMKMLLRLKRESWYSEAFADIDSKLITPARGSAVQFMVQILIRKMPAVRQEIPE